MKLLHRALVALLGLAAVVALVTTPTIAQITVPNTFTPGTTISSSTVNANFTELGTKALNLTGGTMTGTLTSQQITPSTTATYDIGTSLVKFRDAFFSRNLSVGGTLGVTGNTTLPGTLTTGSGSVALTDATGKIPGVSSTYFASVDGSALTGLNGTNISSGTVGVARLGSGTGSSSNYLRGDGAWTSLAAGDVGSGTFATARLGSGSATNATFLRGDGTWASVINVSEYDAGNSSTAITLNFATNGPLQKVTRNGSATYTLTSPTYPGTVVVKFVHTTNATAYTVTFSPLVKWPGGTSPTWTNTSGAVDLVSFYWDGTAWYGIQSANYS